MVGPAQQTEAALDSQEAPTRTNPQRRRCRNCGKLFDAFRIDHWFHNATCRKQFHRDGTAFGKLKQSLTKHIEKEITRQLAVRGILTLADVKLFITRDDVDEILSDARYVSTR